MRALITGGAGFIGSHLAEALLGHGHKVMVIDDLSTGRFSNIEHLTSRHDFDFALETITNETVMDRLVSECDVIFHLAAAVGVQLVVSHPVHVIETNVFGSGMVLRLANRYRRKVLLASTSEVYGKGTSLPFGEGDDRFLGPTTRSRWSYACSKAMDEFLALAYYKQNGLPVVVFRLFNTVGPRQTGRYGMVVPRFIDQALRGEPLTVYGDGEQTRCFADVRDVIKAIVGLSDCPDAVGEVLNIGSMEEVSMTQLAGRVIELAGSHSEIIYVPYSEAYEAGFEDFRRRVPDIAKIQQLIGFTPQYNLDDILLRIIDEMRSQGGNSD